MNFKSSTIRGEVVVKKSTTSPKKVNKAGKENNCQGSIRLVNCLILPETKSYLGLV